MVCAVFGSLMYALYASKPPCDASEFGSVVVGFRSLLSDSMTSATAATAGIPDRTLLAEVESLGSSFDESNQLSNVFRPFFRRQRGITNFPNSLQLLINHYS